MVKHDAAGAKTRRKDKFNGAQSWLFVEDCVTAQVILKMYIEISGRFILMIVNEKGIRQSMVWRAQQLTGLVTAAML